MFAEIIRHQIDGLIISLGHDRRRPIGPTHQSNSYATEPGLKRGSPNSFPDREPNAVGDAFLGMEVSA